VRLLAELCRCLLLAWRWRHLRYGTVSAYARSALLACELVAEMRARYPGRRLFWSYSTNHVTDSSQEYVAVWEVSRRGDSVLAEMVYHGPREILRGKVAEGYFDRVLGGDREEPES
jgi:hypothetical protein